MVTELTKQIEAIATPAYVYDLGLLRNTLQSLSSAAKQYGYQVHYALKANADRKVLSIINSFGLGADCVSGYEVARAAEVGFPVSKIVFAGVGKSDKEIIKALELGIFSFNVESVQEIEVIAELAQKVGKKASIALRLNPEVDAQTHKHITTGTAANKFGLRLFELNQAVEIIQKTDVLDFIGIHFHIGSQITTDKPFEDLCHKVNYVQELLEEKGIQLPHLNMGGGLGIDYENPEANPIADFERFFAIVNKHLKVKQNQQVHFELGRSIVAQCGSLLTKVLFVKEYDDKNFAVTDAGMTELMRPALYSAYHKIINLSSESDTKVYDVVGPICESTDTLGHNCKLPKVARGHILAVQSAGAYGEVMASHYNLRPIAPAYYVNE